MASMKYCDKHNQVGFLKKPKESTGFAEIVDFLKGLHIRYALTHNLTIHDSLVKQFWQTATASTLADGTLELRATIDTLEYTITEASVRSKLQLADASGISMLPNTEIFEGMGNMGYPADGTFTFWKSHFTPQWRFLVHHILHCMSPKSGGWDQFGSNLATALICLSTGRIYNFSKLIFDGMVANLKSKTKFLMYPRFLQMILEIQTENKHPYLAIVLTKKIFGNMKRGFRGVPRPLLPAMLPVVAVDQSAGQADQAVDQPSPSEPLPSSSHPPVLSATTESEPTPVAEQITHPTSLTPEPDSEPIEHTFEQPSPEHQPLSPRQETEVPQSQDPTHPHVAEERTMTVDDLLQLVPKLITKVDSLETELKQTKLTMGKALVKLVKKVKKMEDVLKRRHVVLPDSEDEDAEISSKQGRNLQEEGLDEMVRNMMKDKSKVFKTPTQGKTSGEEDISPTTLEAAKTLSKVASQRSKSVDMGKRYKRRKESKGKDIDTGFEDIITGFEDINTGFEEVNTGGLEVSIAPKRTKEQIQQEEASLAEAIRLQTLEEEETAKQVHLDALLAKRLEEKKKDWDAIRAKFRKQMQRLTKNVLGKLSQLKKLKFEEIKEEFDKLVKQIDTFVPINIEATKAQLKRYGDELQTEILKKQRIDDKDVSETEEKVGKVKEEEPVKRVGKRKKQKARKGISIDKSPQGNSETDKEESVEVMNPTPLYTKSNIVANWKIFQQGERSIYHIIRANKADTIYMSFRAMLKDFTREDLIELYRLVMQKYGTNRPEDAYDRVLWSDLRTMFDPPLNEDAIWSLPLQQKIINRKYPLSKDACQVMLKMKLLDGKMNEVCYKLLKMIEKQDGIKNCEASSKSQIELFFVYKDPIIESQDMSTSTTHQQSLADASSETRPSMLERGTYIPWASHFRRIQTEDDLIGDNLKHYKAEIEAMNLILISILNDIYNSVDACTTTQAMWQRVKHLMRGTVQNKVDRETRFNNEFDQFITELGEALVSINNRCAHLMNDLEQNGIKFPKVTVNTKFLNCLQPEWLKYATQVRLAKRLTNYSYDDLFDYLSQYKKVVNASRVKKLENSHDPLALLAHTGSSSRIRSPYYVTHVGPNFFDYLHYELLEDFVSIIFGIILELQHDDFPV
ncbi:hypothetical protein Tco_0558753 [Tanacetum coccineum]